MFALFPNFNKAGKTLTEICSEARENIRKVDKTVQFKNPISDIKTKRKRIDSESQSEAAVLVPITSMHQPSTANLLYSDRFEEIHHEEDDGTQDGYPDDILSSQYGY